MIWLTKMERKKVYKNYENVFEVMKNRKSILLTIFTPKNAELLNIGAQAPSPSKDYCNLVLTYDKV